MPIYEYVCKRCSEVFSLYRSITESESDTKCPKCDSNDVKKMISSFGSCSIGGRSIQSSGSLWGFGGG